MIWFWNINEKKLNFFLQSYIVGVGKGCVDNDANEFLEIMAKKKKSRTTIMKTQLDYYLEEDNLSVTQEFDILSWWKKMG